MSLLTDDQDIRDVRFYMEHAGNGDYYMNMVQHHDSVESDVVQFRVSTSGGNAPTEVKIAVANLFRAMEAAGLNEISLDDLPYRCSHPGEIKGVILKKREK